MSTISEIHQLHDNKFELDIRPTYERVREFYQRVDNFYHKSEEIRKNEYILNHEKTLENLINNPRISAQLRNAIEGVRTRLNNEIGKCND